MSRPKIDWEAVEVDYRCGIKSLRTIAAQHGCAESAIRKRAIKEQWPRDLSAKIKARADDLVRKEEVRGKVRTETVTEKQQVEIGAEVQKDIILSHRKDIQRNRSLAMKLLEELEAVTDNRGLFEEIGEILRSEDDKGMDRRNDLYQRVIDMPSRIDGTKKLAETLKVLVGLERQAFGMKDDTDDKPTDKIRSLLSEIDGNTASLLPE